MLLSLETVVLTVGDSKPALFCSKWLVWNICWLSEWVLAHMNWVFCSRSAARDCEAKSSKHAYFAQISAEFGTKGGGSLVFLGGAALFSADDT